MAQTPDPPHVVADELIESAWGNNVVDIIGPVSTLWQPPPGVSGSVADRLFQLNTRGVASDARITALEKQGRGLGMAAGSATVSTDANGDVNIPFGVQFTGAPAVVVSPGSVDQGWRLTVNNGWTNATSMYVRCWRTDGSTAPAGNALIINWHAVGNIA
jgi:hypothetical protein